MGFLTSIFGKNNTDTSSTDSIEAIINDVDSTPFGSSKSNVLFAGLNELGGYYFFQTVVVGDFKIKTLKGISIQLNAVSPILTLKSDMQEIESEPTSIKGRYVTKVDFEIEEADIETLEQERIMEIIISEKKQEIVFTKYESNDEEE